MKIAHFAPFGPHRSGLYETTKDMIKAERLLGHTSEFVDLGVDGKRKVGAMDPRGGCHVITKSIDDVKDFDIFVSHSDMYKRELEATGAPVVQITHGRPLMSFRSSQNDPKQPVYQIYDRQRNHPRWKLFVALWPEHEPYWRILFDERARSLDAPCDSDRYPPDGKRYQFNPSGKCNVLIADVKRADTDGFPAVHAAIEGARYAGDSVKIHVFALQNPIGPWAYVFQHMKKKGILGETKGIMTGFDQVLRGADIVITSHNMATRIVRESLNCGTPVVAPIGNRHAQWTGPMDSMGAMGSVVARAIAEVMAGTSGLPEQVAQAAATFNLDRFGKEITAIYREALEA